MITVLQPKIQPSDFETLFSHLSSYNPKYKNMQLRKTRKEDGELVLKYLQMVHVKDDRTLEGAISGKGIEIEYEIVRGPRAIVGNFLIKSASERERRRLNKRFVTELLSRVRQEQGFTDKIRINRKKGQFYLKRGPGTPFNSPNCQLALASGELSYSFLEKLEDWDFQVYQGN